MKNKINLIAGSLSGILLVCGVFIYNGTYKDFIQGKSNVVTIGVFSDSYWEVQNGYSYHILEDAIKLFEENNPGIKVEYTSGILKKHYSEWLSAQILSENAPDVFYVLADDFNNFAETGVLEDLSLYIEKDKDFNIDAFYSSAYAYGQYNGKQYCLPYECAPKLMFVNKTILDNEGLEVPDKDWTWDDLYSICEKVTKDTDGNGTVDQFGVIGYTWKEAFESEGINLFNRNGTECYFTDAGIGKALSFIEKLENINSGYNAGSKDFDLGNVVFQPMSFSDYRAYKPYPLSVKKYTGFEWGCIPMPAGPDGDNISTLDTLFIAINEKSRNKKAAWELVKALAYNTEIQSEIFNYSEGVSVLKDVTESEQTLGQMMDGNSLDLAILSNIVEEAVVVPRFGNYEEAVAQVEQAVTAIIEDGYNISMGQIIWNRKINKYLKNSK